MKHPRQRIRLKDISRRSDEPLIMVTGADLLTLPPPLIEQEGPPYSPLSDQQKKNFESSLDGVSALALPRPKNEEEEARLLERFLSGVRKLLSPRDNWVFWQPLIQSLESCVRCQSCSDACPVYVSSGKQEVYRPTYKSEILRRLIHRYLRGRGRILSKLTGEDIELNWPTVARLAELAYRCSLCRRCAQHCPLGCDNGLIGRELRKVFSQEMGIAPREIHELGTVQQLKVGSSTGMTPRALEDVIRFIEEELEERIGRKIQIPMDREGADILFLHNAGEFLAWPENIEAFAILFDAAGISWTLSSELVGYDGVNYGVWYDDIQFVKIAKRHAQVARDLKVKKINVGECGHAHKAFIVIADRVLTGDLNIPRESALPLLEDLVCRDKIRLDPTRNDFAVTLHDPCNLVRLMGIVSPQRRILRKICPQFREMEPHGVDNYCCGGGSGFAVMSSLNFEDWKLHVSGRMKMKQILETFQDILNPEIKKYVCAPCSNCKGQIRDLLKRYAVGDRYTIRYGGLAELIANAMVEVKKSFIEWE